MKLAKKNFWQSRNKKRIVHGILLSISLFTIGFAYETPDLGDSSLSVLSAEKEQEYGKLFMRALARAGLIGQDLIAAQYIQDLGNQLAAYANNPSKHFYFFIVKDPSINAFAGPYGNIGINTGLIGYVANEDQLAAVIAHEIAHVTQNHLTRSMKDEQQRAIPSIFAILGSIATGNPDLAAGVINATIAGNIQASINHTREQEQEADRLGLLNMVKAGFNPYGMADLFKKMQQDQYGKTENFIAFLSNHPSYETRVADAENRSAQYPPIAPHHSLRFYLIQARLSIASNKNNTAATVAATQIRWQQSPNEATHYAYALALANAGKFSDAQQQLQQLIISNPNEIIYPLTVAEVFQANGQYDQAIAALKMPSQLYPDNYPLVMLYGNLLLADKQYAAAVRFLKANYTNYQQDLPFLWLYSNALGKNKELVVAYQIRAQAYVLSDNLPAALSQLDVALKEPTISEYERQAINAQRQDIQKQLAAAKKASRLIA